MFYSIAGLHELGSNVGPLAVVEVDFAVVVSKIDFSELRSVITFSLVGR